MAKTYNGKTLSEVSSSIFRLIRIESEACDEAQSLSAPSECYGDIGRSTDREILRVLSEAGFTPREFKNEVASRTSDKWAHFSGMTRVLDAKEELIYG